MSRYGDPSLIDALMSFGLDVRARRVYLHHELDHAGDELADENGKRAAQHVVRSIQFLDRTSGPIELWVNTPGGAVADMFGIYDVVQACENPVTTVAFGEVCSAGVLVLVAGDHRYATPNSWLMSHAEGGQAVYDVHATSLRMKALMRQEDRWAELMAERTKRDLAFWREVHRTKATELWLSAKQMVQYGIVDAVGTP